MIDFLSTSAHADTQAVRCARLLARVLAMAVIDACRKPGKTEQEEGKNIDSEARAAIWFLFSGESLFPLYARSIGSDANVIRTALLSDVELKARVPSKRPDGEVAQFTESMRRALQWRYRHSRFAREAA